MTALEELFGHHVWATGTLIDFCASLPAERLNAAVPGTYGSVLSTLVHLTAADQRFLDWMSGEPPVTRIEEGMTPTMALLGAAFRASAGRWLALAARAADLHVEIPPRRGRPAWPEAQDLLFVQAIHHGNDHRTQVCTTLSTAGIEAPSLDAWSYWSEAHE